MITREQIIDLMRAAEDERDTELVSLCAVALAGNEQSSPWRKCARIIAERSGA